MTKYEIIKSPLYNLKMKNNKQKRKIGYSIVQADNSDEEINVWVRVCTEIITNQTQLYAALSYSQ